MWNPNQCGCPPQPTSGGFVANEFPQLTTDFSSGCEPVVLTAGGWGGCNSPILTAEVPVPWPAPCPPTPCPPGPAPCPPTDLNAQLVAALIAALQGQGKSQCGCGNTQQQLWQIQQQLLQLERQKCWTGFAPPPAGQATVNGAAVAPGYAPPPPAGVGDSQGY